MRRIFRRVPAVCGPTPASAGLLRGSRRGIFPLFFRRPATREALTAHTLTCRRALAKRRPRGTVDVAAKVAMYVSSSMLCGRPRAPPVAALQPQPSNEIGLCAALHHLVSPLHALSSRNALTLHSQRVSRCVVSVCGRSAIAAPTASLEDGGIDRHGARRAASWPCTSRCLSTSSTPTRRTRVRRALSY